MALEFLEATLGCWMRGSAFIWGQPIGGSRILELYVGNGFLDISPTKRIATLESFAVGTSVTGNTLTALTWTLRLRYWNGSALVTAASIVTPFPDALVGQPINPPPQLRTAWPTHRLALRVRSSTYDTIAATYALDGEVYGYVDDVLRISATGLRIAQHDTLQRVLPVYAIQTDLDRCWLVSGSIAPSTDVNGQLVGMPVPVFYDDFTSGSIASYLPVGMGVGGFVLSPIVVQSDVGAAGGPGISTIPGGLAGSWRGPTAAEITLTNLLIGLGLPDLTLTPPTPPTPPPPSACPVPVGETVPVLPSACAVTVLP